MALSERALQSIDEFLSAGSVRDHDFLLRWSAGELTRDDLRAFASQFYHLVDALPRCISRTHAASADPALRRPLVAVLSALDGSSPTAGDLWLQTCAALGLFSDSVRRAPLAPGAEQCVFTLSRLSASGPVEGLAAVYALLRQLPLVCRLQRDGLARHYGMDGGPGMAFFDAFGYQVETHARTLRELLGRAIHSDDDAQAARAAAHDATVAFEALLTGAMSPAEPVA